MNATMQVYAVSIETTIREHGGDRGAMQRDLGLLAGERVCAASNMK